MDTPTTTYQPTHISLCSGYGGIDLGLKRCISSLRTVAYAEIETSAIELLLARMEGGQLDPAPIWTDLRSFPWEAFSGRVDILSGGYPCQPFSSAGKRLGADDPRHLWPAIAAGIRLLKPRLCFFENVEGHISLGLRDVLRELGELGYRATWGIFSASEVGAPHQRKRVFVLAYDKCAGLEGLNKWNTPSEQTQLVRANTRAGGECPAWPSRPGEPQHAWEPPRVVGNATSRAAGDDAGACSGAWVAMEGKCVLHAEGDEEEHLVDASSAVVGDADCGRQPFSLHAGVGAETDRGGQSDVVSPEPGQTQPALGRSADGPASRLDYVQLCVSCDNRTDELRMLGNGVVPATAEKAFRTLIKELLQ